MIGTKGLRTPVSRMTTAYEQSDLIAFVRET